MKDTKRVLVFMLLAAILLNTLLVSADIGVNAQQNDNTRNSRVINVLTVEPESLDPQIATSQSAQNIVNSLLEGLMRRSGNSVLPGMASHYEISKDGLTYTFFLRDAVWSDGKSVTASDFAYAWKRALDAKTNSSNAASFFCIKNGEKYNKGRTTVEQLGIKVINPKTLQVTLEAPTPYFVELTANVAFMPVRKDLIDKYGDINFYDVYNFVTNGPFTLKEWSFDRYLVVEKSSTYWNRNKIEVDGVNFHIDYPSSNAIEAYLNGELDILNIPKESLNKVPQNETVCHYTGSIRYVQFNNKDKTGILTNSNIRKALTLSINRQEFVKELYESSGAPAFSLIAPEVILGKSKSYREEAGSLITDNDINTAKAALSLGLKQLKLKKLPELTIVVDDSYSSKEQAKALAQMWKQNLGIDVYIETPRIQYQIERINSGDYQMVLRGLWPRNNSPLSYLDMFNSGSYSNTCGYKNDEFNNLIKNIKKELDRSKRIDLIRKAEKKILDDFVVAPLYFETTYLALKSYIKNLQISNAGILYDFTSMKIQENEKVVRTLDQKFSMKVTLNWFKEYIRNISLEDDIGILGADLEIINFGEEAGGIVYITEAIEAEANIEAIADKFIAQIEELDANAKFHDKSVTKINGHYAVKFKQFVTVDEIQKAYYYTLIGTPKAVYLVIFMCPNESIENYSQEFDRMLSSIVISE